MLVEVVAAINPSRLTSLSTWKEEGLELYLFLVGSTSTLDKLGLSGDNLAGPKVNKLYAKPSYIFYHSILPDLDLSLILLGAGSSSDS